MPEGRDDKRRLPDDTATEANSGEQPKHDGYWDAKPSDNPAGYGGDRERGEEFSRGSFGDAGWSASRKPGDQPESAQDPQRGADDYRPPAGATPTATSSRGWDEDYVAENADKYGQAGGKPTEQRGPSHSEGGLERNQPGQGETEDPTPRGTYSAKDVGEPKRSINSEHKGKP